MAFNTAYVQKKRADIFEAIKQNAQNGTAEIIESSMLQMLTRLN